MKALVKPAAEPGLVLTDVPEPAIGINDVLIRVHKTGICGTDVHIYKWDAWAQKTIPVADGRRARVRRRSCRSRLQCVNDFKTGDVVSGEGPRGMRPLPQLHGWSPSPLRGLKRHRRQSTGSVRRIRSSLPMTNVWMPRSGDRYLGTSQAIFDPLGNAVHSALSFDRVRAKTCLITGAGPIGRDGRRRSCVMPGARHVVITDREPLRDSSWPNAST